MRDRTRLETLAEVETDPVCGMRVATEQAREHDLALEYEGREYTFCCPACRQRFARTPRAYAVPGRSEP